MAKNNPDSPESISKNITLTEENWEYILNEIDKMGVFVTLDLSACTKSTADTGGGLRADGIFDPLPGNINGKSKIVSLVLPDEALSIVDAIYHYDSYLQFIWISVFKSFSNLKTISGEKINSIDSSAFKNCKTITGVDFPAANLIEEFAFSGCTALVNANLPQARRIQTLAFQNCKALSVINFPEILSVNKAAFEGCTSLSSACFPMATSFGANIFGHTGNKPLTITLGKVAPYIWGSLFSGISAAKSTTIKIPNEASGFDSSWKQKFNDNNHVSVSIVIEEKTADVSNLVS